MISESVSHSGFLSRHGLWLGTVLPALLLGILYHQGIAYMVGVWSADETYGHAFFVPFISLFLIWRRRERLREIGLAGSWWGLPVVFSGLILYFAGTVATLYVLVHLSLLLVVIGLLLTAIGGCGVREISFPLLYLLTMIPLPDFLYQGFSARLQLISSKLGVGCLQLVGVTAYREGNVIDLGPIQLQVVEACSGLRYLFPLSALALICAYLYRDRLWKRIVLFLSSIPIAVLLNGFRIGVTGLLVDLYGKGLAEGFFHSFSGWLLFVFSLFILFGEMWVLNRIGRSGKKRRPLSEAFGPDAIAGSARGVGGFVFRKSGSGPVSYPYLFTLVLFVPVVIASSQIASRKEVIPLRRDFSSFPMQLGNWSGKSFQMEEEYASALRFDDYILADYRGPEGAPINLYMAYYRSQKMGQSTHSPRTCIPGGGWEIDSLEQRKIGSMPAGEELSVNRAVIQKGIDRRIVFYWFQQRGRILTNEYLVKFYLFWDALTRNRSDGALVRLTAPVSQGESEAEVDRHLAAFAKKLEPLLSLYIPH